jgi:two-component system KDP operon response regulator KdpE
MNKQVILIIDDEPQIRKLLVITLGSNGFNIVEAETATEGMLEAANKSPDLILLDIGLPDKSGHDVLRNLREWYTKPIIILSAQDNEEDIVSALERGANDYIAKPFRTSELLARLRSVLQKSSTKEDALIISCGDLLINLRTQTVKRQGVIVKLTELEYFLLLTMARNEGTVLTHGYLLNQVYGSSFINEVALLKVLIASLRKKIETDPNRPLLIITERGIGYRFTRF